MGVALDAQARLELGCGNRILPITGMVVCAQRADTSQQH
jgi:hypothetical protein